MWLASLVVGILFVVIMVACLGLVQKLQHNKERISQLNSEIIKEEQRAADIEEYRQYTETKEYIEEIARKKLSGLSMTERSYSRKRRPEIRLPLERQLFYLCG